MQNKMGTHTAYIVVNICVKRMMQTIQKSLLVASLFVRGEFDDFIVPDTLQSLEKW